MENSVEFQDLVSWVMRHYTTQSVIQRKKGITVD